MDDLTRDAQKLLALMYRDYLAKRKAGQSKESAKQVGDIETVQSNLLPSSSADDVLETCRELDRSNYLQVYYADNTIYHAWLSDRAIIVMENRFKNNISTVLDFLSKFV